MTRTIDDFNILALKKLDAISISDTSSSTSPTASTMEDTIIKLTTKISQLENKIDEQSSTLEALQNDRHKIHDENSTLTQHVLKLIASHKSLVNAHYKYQYEDSRADLNGDNTANETQVIVPHRDKTMQAESNDVTQMDKDIANIQLNSYKRQAPTKRKKNSVHVSNCSSVSTGGGIGHNLGAEEGSTSAGRTELMVSVIFDCSRAKISPLVVAQVILSTVLPSFSKNDIVSVRQTARPIQNRSSTVESECPKAAMVANDSRPPPLIVGLTSVGKIHKIMRA